MAKKTKRPQASRRNRQQKNTKTAPPTPQAPAAEQPFVPGAWSLDSPAIDTGSVPTTPTPSSSVARRVERVQPGTQPLTQKPGERADATPLSPEDSAIPFARVPYVPADLRRVAYIATMMVVLIIIADIIVNRVVT